MDNAHWMAATLAIDVVKERPGIDESTAAVAAWRAFKNTEGRSQAKFQSANYVGEVTRAMREIQSGRLERVEHSLGLLKRALEELDQLQSK